MSRCFQFPPPGYTLSRAGNEFLIESIKLRNEREKAKDQKRKEKKEKKKDDKRKDKKKDRNQSIANSKTLKHDYPVTKGELSLKEKEPQIEQLEESSLTEDHLLPPVRFDIPSTSSDSTNSHKRKRESLPLNESPGHGKVIRIKLSTKQNESNAFANANKMQPCSKSGNTNAVKMDDSNSNLKFGRENSSPTRKIDRRQISSTSQHVEGVTEGKTVFPSVPKARQDGYNVAMKNSSSAQKSVGEKICSTSKPVESLSKAKIGIPSVPKAPKNDSCNNLRYGSKNSTSALKIAGETIHSTSQPVESVTNGISSVANAPKDGFNVGRENSNSAPKNVGQKIPSTSQPDESVAKRKCEIPSVPKVPKGNSNNDLRDGRENSNAALEIAGVKICSISQPGIPSLPKAPKATTSHMQRKELRYNELCNLSLPQLQNSCLDDEDLDWLLRNPTEKRQKTQNDDISCSNSFALQPRAQFLKGVEMYALPFTVPF